MGTPSPNRYSGNQSRRGQPKKDLGFWIAAISFLVILPPVGILMLVLKLLNRNSARTPSRHPYYLRKEADPRVGARTVQTGTQATPRTEEDTTSGARLSRLNLRAKRITTLGAVLSVIFGFAAITSAAEYLWVLPDIAWYLEEVIPVSCFFFGGLGCLWAGLRQRGKVRRFRTYLAMTGTRSSVSIASLASAMGTSQEKVLDELEDMLDEGLFPVGYLDYGSKRLVLSGGGLADPPPKKKAAKKKEPSEADQQTAVLEEIRTINAGIDNTTLNQQIERIGSITAKVFEYQRNHPDKSTQLHNFLNYYLPTTLKILRAYAQLEDQEVEGENITASMERIEGMMEKLVDGFEKQLDQLFQGDALDIAADVEVLERMLAKDGLSSDEGLRLGGS